MAGALLVGIAGYGSVANPSFVTSTAANIFANLSTNLLTHVCRFGDEAYLSNYQRIDQNHVVTRAVRTAQLDALAAILQRFDAARRNHRDPAQDSFAGLLHEFLRQERVNARKLRFEGPPAASQAEVRLRRELVELLPNAAAAALAARRGPAAADRDRFRRICEIAVLTELRALVFEEVPPLFLSAFQGRDGGNDGWFDLFFRQVAADIKQGGEFAQIWQAEQQAALAFAVAAQSGQTADIAQAAAAIRDGVVAQGTALSALAGEVDALRDHLAAIRSRTLGDDAVPLDFPAVVDTEGVRRFAPRNPLIPFFGRGAEMAALGAFLNAPPDFAWWLLCGAGGAGKTRLALRLAMLAHAEGWRAGFLPDPFTADPAALDAWHPQQPTLLVADYTLKRRDAVRLLAQRLARRAGKLPHPVRLLLIERNGGDGFDAQFLAADT